MRIIHLFVIAALVFAAVPVRAGASLGGLPFGVDLMLPAGVPERSDPEEVAAVTSRLLRSGLERR